MNSLHDFGTAMCFLDLLYHKVSSLRFVQIFWSNSWFWFLSHSYTCISPTKEYKCELNLMIGGPQTFRLHIRSKYEPILSFTYLAINSLLPPGSGKEATVRMSFVGHPWPPTETASAMPLLDQLTWRTTSSALSSTSCIHALELFTSELLQRITLRSCNEIPKIYADVVIIKMSRTPY